MQFAQLEVERDIVDGAGDDDRGDDTGPKISFLSLFSQRSLRLHFCRLVLGDEMAPLPRFPCLDLSTPTLSFS